MSLSHPSWWWLVLERSSFYGAVNVAQLRLLRCLSLLQLHYLPMCHRSAYWWAATMVTLSSWRSTRNGRWTLSMTLAAAGSQLYRPSGRMTLRWWRSTITTQSWSSTIWRRGTAWDVFLSLRRWCRIRWQLGFQACYPCYPCSSFRHQGMFDLFRYYVYRCVKIC